MSFKLLKNTLFILFILILFLVPLYFLYTYISSTKETPSTDITEKSVENVFVEEKETARLNSIAAIKDVDTVVHNIWSSMSAAEDLEPISKMDSIYEDKNYFHVLGIFEDMNENGDTKTLNVTVKYIYNRLTKEEYSTDEKKQTIFSCSEGDSLYFGKQSSDPTDFDLFINKIPSGSYISFFCATTDCLKAEGGCFIYDF